jgi:hypothetical protein
VRASHNRALIAARVKTAPAPVLAPSIDLRARVQTVVHGTGPGIRRTKAKMTGAQRNSEGRRSEWSMSQNNRDGRDPRWDGTVSRG